MNLVNIIKIILLTTPSVTEEDSMVLLEGVAGRGLGQYGSRLKYWLESNPNAFPEPVEVNDIDSFNDHGVDVFLRGMSSRLCVGFQIKSEGDLKRKDFTVRLKGQITDARKYGLNLLVIIFACRPTSENRAKYSYIQAETVGYNDDKILVIDPMRAAGLLRAFESILPPINLTKDWQDLFIATKQMYLAPLYLDDWWGLKPDERFRPPKEFQSILEAVDTYPLTIISGPPAIGKTFTVLQVIWKKYKEGRDISWIGPSGRSMPEGILSHSDTMPDLKERIDSLTRKLGPMDRPLKDVHDFISAQLELNKIVYIEDPFGKTNQEFAYSLHTYEFFDLNKFVSSINKGTPRHGCHIVITTREGLFDRWIDDCKRNGATLPNFKLIRMGTESYSYGQVLSFAFDLAVARGIPEPKKIVRLLAPNIKVPFDVERIMRELPEAATYELIVDRVNAFNGDLQEILNKRLLADNDAERLFLLLLATLSDRGYGRNNFYDCYKNLYQVLLNSGDFDESLMSAMERYRPFFSRLEYTTLGYVGKVFKPTEVGFHLEPIHSSIAEKIVDNLRNTAGEWLSRVAASLPKVQSDFEVSYRLRIIALHLLEWEITKTRRSAEKGVIKVLLQRKGITRFEMPRLISSWSILSDRAKKEALGYLSHQENSVIEQFCGSLEQSDISPEDAWGFLRLLVPKPYIGTRTFNVFGNPWGYLSKHLNEIPIDLKRSLDERAQDTPDLFTYALSDVLVNCWKITPSSWREAFLNPECLSDSSLQEKTLIDIARGWKKADEELRVLLDQQSKHKDYRIRAAAGIAALVYYESSPESLEPIFMRSLKDENIQVPLLVMQDGLGKDEHDHKFAQSLFERANEATAAYMLNLLLHRRDLKEASWKFELAQQCIAKGGQLAQAVLLFNHFSYEREQTEYLGYIPPDSPMSESEPIRLAWLWLYTNQDNNKRDLSVTQVINLLTGLTYPYRQLALANFSVQANHIPKELQKLLKTIEVGTDNDAAAIKEGKKHRQPKKSRNTTYGFPIHHFITANLYEA